MHVWGNLPSSKKTWKLSARWSVLVVYWKLLRWKMLNQCKIERHRKSVIIFSGQFFLIKVHVKDRKASFLRDAVGQRRRELWKWPAGGSGVGPKVVMNAARRLVLTASVCVWLFSLKITLHYQSVFSCNATLLPQCDPPDHAVPEREQPLSHAEHLTGGDHPVAQHSGEHWQLHCRHKERPLGLRPPGYRVSKAAR